MHACVTGWAAACCLLTGLPACIVIAPCRVQLDWFELYLRAQEERGYEGSFNMFMQLQVRSEEHRQQ